MIQIGTVLNNDAGGTIERWFPRRKNFDGLILLTRKVTPEFKDTVKQMLDEGIRFLVQIGVSGLDTKIYEPNLESFNTQLKEFRSLIDDVGMKPEHLILRIDPMVGIRASLDKVKLIVKRAIDFEIPYSSRIKVATLKEFPIIKKRLQETEGARAYYNEDYAYPERWRSQKVQEFLEELGVIYSITFETCCEPNMASPHVVQTGCVSTKDLQALGLGDEGVENEDNRRRGCKCLRNRVDILGYSVPCPYKCLYCPKA